LLAVQTLSDWGAGSLTAVYEQVASISAKPAKPATSAKSNKSAVHTSNSLQGKPQPSAQIDATQDFSSVMDAVSRLPSWVRYAMMAFALLLFGSIAAWSWNIVTGRPRSAWLEGAIVAEFFGLVLILGMADLLEIWASHAATAAAAQILNVVQPDKWGAGPSPHLDVLAGFATLCAAVVASCRYVMEKFSWRSELHSYEEALDVFKRAQAQITAIETSGWSPEDQVHAYRQVVFAVGKQALSENERWLRAHRERPLEPVFST
jgi:hypothetical protein